ncbi:MAG: ATP-binding protein [Ignavibacteriales bacterium]|nr:ATP-binding protein [Ignavibacteriales bacterium]
MNQNELKKLLESLINLPKENEWVEFKTNYVSIEEIGELISALSNSACLHNQPFGYLVFGVENESHKIVGTTFKPKSDKKGNEELENWLAQRLSPRIDFRIFEFFFDEKQISLFEVPSVKNEPVSFLHEEYIRVGSITRKLKDLVVSNTS